MTLSIFSGVPAAGKGYVTDKLKEYLPGLEMHNYADMMIEVGKEAGIFEGNDHDELRRLDKSEQKYLQDLASKKLGNLGKDGNIGIDTHVVVKLYDRGKSKGLSRIKEWFKTKVFKKLPEGYLRGLPENVLKNLKPDYFFLIESDPEVIAERRAEDETRVRDQDKSIDGIREHIELTVQEAYNCSGFVKKELEKDCRVLRVMNEDGKDDAALQISSFYKSKKSE